MRDSNRKNQDAKSAPTAKVGSSSSLSGENVVDMAHFLQSGWRVAASLLIPAFLGIWLDRTLGTKDVFTIIGVIIGIILVKVVVYQFVKAQYYSGGER